MHKGSVGENIVVTLVVTLVVTQRKADWIVRSSFYRKTKTPKK